MGAKPRKRTQRMVYTATGWLPKGEPIEDTARAAGLAADVIGGDAAKRLLYVHEGDPGKDVDVAYVKATVTIKIEDL